MPSKFYKPRLLLFPQGEVLANNKEKAVIPEDWPGRDKI
jgi:hypothetical protein